MELNDHQLIVTDSEGNDSAQDGRTRVKIDNGTNHAQCNV